MTDEAVRKWRDSGRYLPRFLRDFHDQKDAFKAIHETIAVEKHNYCSEISWVAGQCYVIDIFLWHMARHGWTLQRSRKKLAFDDIDATTVAAKEQRFAAFRKMDFFKGATDAEAAPLTSQNREG